MAKTLVVAEKPSVGSDLARTLPGSFAKHEGYLESERYVVTWAINRLADPKDDTVLDEYFRIGDGKDRELAVKALSALSSYSPHPRIAQYLRRKMTDSDRGLSAVDDELGAPHLPELLEENAAHGVGAARRRIGDHHLDRACGVGRLREGGSDTGKHRNGTR